MENSALNNLKKGELLIVSARGVKNGKVSLMFAQKITNPNLRPSSIIGALNSSDDRFTQEEKPRFAWVTGELADINSRLGLNLTALEEGATADINKLNPEIEGMKLNIQITETTKGSEFDVANIEKRAKRAGKDGDYILSPDGEYIFVNATVVAGTAKHVFISDTMRSSEASTSAEDAIADAVG